MTHALQRMRQPRGRLPALAARATILWSIAAMVAGPSAGAGAASPSQVTGVAAGEPALDPGRLVATGPFGSVDGLSQAVGSPAPNPAGLEALDAYGRGARLRITPAAGSFGEWRVTALRESSVDPGSGSELGSGGSDTVASFRMPASGLFLVRLDGTILDPAAAGAATPGTWYWRIAVPDRDVPDGGDPYPPMPAVLLTSADQSVALDPGSGCFIGTCGDIGATSPPRMLPTIRTLAGAPLSVHLSDGSGISAWSADATPVGATDRETIPIGGGSTPSATSSLTFAAPPMGRWVILVHVRFDRDRGATDGYGRLILE